MNRKTTLNQFIEKLIELRDEYDCGDAVIRMAYQPRYPIAALVDEVTFVKNEEHRPKVVWLAEGHIGSHLDESPYAPSQAWSGEEVDLNDEQ